MATITATPDAARVRVGVELAAWSADGPATVFRVHGDTGARYEVRGLSAVSGGAAFAWDYEAPFDVSVSYEAANGGALVSSAAVVLPAAGAWLSVPGLPSFGGRVRPLAKPSTNRQRPTAALSPLGRVRPIVLSDSLKAPEFGLSLRTKTFAEGDALESALSIAATLLLRVPGARVPYAYVSVSGVSESPAVPYRAGADAPEVAEWATWSLDLREVDAPEGGVYGDPTASYEVVAATYASYSALSAADTSYLDTLKGV